MPQSRSTAMTIYTSPRHSNKMVSMLVWNLLSFLEFSELYVACSAVKALRAVVLLKQATEKVQLRIVLVLENIFGTCSKAVV